MLVSIHPKLPMRDKIVTRSFYVNQLGFEDIGAEDYPDYLMVKKEGIEIHFFLFKELNPPENYGQVYIRTAEIDNLYAQSMKKKLRTAKYGQLEVKPWGQKEFSLLDPDHNLLTFGELSSTT